MRSPAYHNFQVGFLILAFQLITGCAAAIIGVGVGIGAAAYVNGELTKTYRSGYHETAQTSIDTLKKLKIPIDEKISDELKTSIKAARPDGTPIRIEIVRIEKKLTEVGVRTGSVGLWDQKVSKQIQDIIGERLNSEKELIPGASKFLDTEPKILLPTTTLLRTETKTVELKSLFPLNGARKQHFRFSKNFY